VPRQPRFEAPGAIHHVVSRGNAGESIVRNDVDRHRFVFRLGESVSRSRWDCLAYCLLDTHFHLIVRTPEPNLADGMRWFKSRYAQDLNSRHGRAGHVFGGRYYSSPLRNGDHLIAALVYVYLNPVRAGVVRLPEEWVWSSYGGTVGRTRPVAFVDVAAVLELWGRDRTIARTCLSAAVEETLVLDRAHLRGQTLRV